MGSSLVLCMLMLLVLVLDTRLATTPCLILFHCKPTACHWPHIILLLRCCQVNHKTTAYLFALGETGFRLHIHRIINPVCRLLNAARRRLHQPASQLARSRPPAYDVSAFAREWRARRRARTLSDAEPPFVSKSNDASSRPCCRRPVTRTTENLESSPFTWQTQDRTEISETNPRKTGTSSSDSLSNTVARGI